MKTKLLYSALVASCIVALSSCDPNDWNDKLDGFDGDKGITNKQMIAYTFTDADYTNLAANSANIKQAGDTLSKELKAVGTQHYFTDKITARDYIPNFLSDSDFAYFTLSDGSSINITYRVAGNVPEEVTNFGAASEYTVTETDYQDAWGSEEDYIEAFSPIVSAQKHIPSILSVEYGDAKKGDMVIVNYKQTETEPSFGGSGNDPAPGYEMTSALGSVAVGSNVTVKGLVTAICARGFILTDNSGSILVYYASGFDATAYKVGDQVDVTGEVSAYNKGFQITGTTATVTVTGNQAYSYPSAKVLDGKACDALLGITDNQLAVFAQFTGKVTISGNFYNFTIDGAETAIGSLYQATDEQKALFENDKTYTVTGYFTSISGGKYVNFVPTAAVEAKATKSRRALRAATAVTSKSVSAVYAFDGNNWKANTSINLLQATDYTAMGMKYFNLEKPDEYLPTYLKVNFPYAKAGDTKLVAYKYYASSKTSLVCDQYTFNGSLWQKTNGVTEESAQFVRTNGKWMYDPNVEITLPSGKGVEISTKYYQACVDWVYEHIDKPLGSTGLKDGNFYISKYGNNEYYCGTSAYQGNVDLRPAKAKEQYPAGYEGMTDEQIETLMMDRFCKEVLPGALAKLHADAAPVAGLEVVYTINFAVYNNATTNHTVRYKVTAPGTFEFIDCTWYEK